VLSGWREAAGRRGLEIEAGGIEPLGHFSFKGGEPLEMKTLFVQLMLERGFLASTAFYASYAHKGRHLRDYLEAVDESFGIIADAHRAGKVKSLLQGPAAHGGFKRLA
jgi:hypothetical protein